MFEKKEVPKHQRMLEEELVRALASLNRSMTDSEEYAKTLTVVERLNEMLEKEQKPTSVSKDTLATVGANLLGIIMILRYESGRVNLITSKAMGLLLRLRA